LISNGLGISVGVGITVGVNARVGINVGSEVAVEDGAIAGVVGDTALSPQEDSRKVKTSIHER